MSKNLKGKIMAHSPIKKELTKEAFAARLFSENQGKIQPLWLCTCEEVKQSMKDDFEKAYDSWVQEELEMAARREKNNPLKNVEIIELKDGETRWDYMDD